MSYPAEIYPNAVVLEVYDQNSELRGKVRIDYMGFIGEVEHPIKGKYVTDAWLLLPYGFKPNTDEAQVTTKNLESAMNQPYGIIAPPRRGDKVVAMYAGPDRWFILGAAGVSGGNEPPISDLDDVSVISRSGASIRLNDTHPTVPSTPDEYDGITGNMMIVANRPVVLSGSYFLPYGLLGKHATHTDIKFDLNERDADGNLISYSYGTGTTEKFRNTSPASTDYYIPWSTITTSDYLLAPPDTLDNDAYYNIHQGGGVIKIYPQPTNMDYTGIKMASAGWKVSVGDEYWDAGLQDEDGAHAGTANSDVEMSDPEDGVAKIQTADGAYLELDEADVRLVSEGTVYLGDKAAANNIITDADTTDVHIVINAFGIPTYEAPSGHDHGLTASQTEVKVP